MRVSVNCCFWLRTPSRLHAALKLAAVTLAAVTLAAVTLAAMTLAAVGSGCRDSGCRDFGYRDFGCRDSGCRDSGYRELGCRDSDCRNSAVVEGEHKERTIRRHAENRQSTKTAEAVTSRENSLRYPTCIGNINFAHFYFFSQSRFSKVRQNSVCGK